MAYYRFQNQGDHSSGKRALPLLLNKYVKKWYEDVVALAFPTPETDYRIADIDEKALYYRAPYTSQPGVLPYIPNPASMMKQQVQQ